MRVRSSTSLPESYLIDFSYAESIAYLLYFRPIESMQL